MPDDDIYSGPSFPPADVNFARSSAEAERKRNLRQRMSAASQRSKSDFGNMPGGFVPGGSRTNSSSYEGPAVNDFAKNPTSGTDDPTLTKAPVRRFRGNKRPDTSSEADRLMDIYNKQGGASSSDIEAAYRSINPTMKKGGRVASKKASKPVAKSSKPKAMKYARGGGIESRGKTRGRFV